MRRLLRLWFGLEGAVDRRTYLLHGAALMAVKYGVDALAVWLATGRVWTLADYTTPAFTVRGAAIGPDPLWLLIAMGTWAVPFLCIGVSLTLRRAIDAGLSPWTALLFFVPYLNWGLMLLLSALRTSPRKERFRLELEEEHRARAAFRGLAAGVLVGGASLLLHLLFFRTYSAAVFLGTPFTMGAAAGWFYNRGALREKKATARLGALTIAVAGLASVLFAIEGVLCVGMSLPLLMPIGMLGALAGRAMRAEHLATTAALPLLVALPVSAMLDARLGAPPLREVVTSVEIAASPARVWPHVLGFADLPPPPDWFFRLGIAYPVRARISGTGVGAVRQCEFSTGAFVEPITAWDPPRRLAFDVSSQPASMQEWSPYRRLHPPHLDGTMRSRRGEFRLVALPGGRTRLEGSTWYELQMGPQAYWSIWSDLLVHRIHRRVLTHIRAEVEAETRPGR